MNLVIFPFTAAVAWAGHNLTPRPVIVGLIWLSPQAPSALIWSVTALESDLTNSHLIKVLITDNGLRLQGQPVTLKKKILKDLKVSAQ